MKKTYVFRMLDQIISHDINPEELYPVVLSEEQVSEYINRIDQEKEVIQQRLLETVFRQKEFRHERNLVQKYHEALVLLVNKTYHYVHHPQSVATGSLAVQQFLLKTLLELLNFVQVQFSNFLDADERMPITELEVLKKEILSKMEPLDEQLALSGNSADLRGILKNFWNRFLERIEEKEIITIREAEYHRQVLKDVEEKYETGVSTSGCPSLHELLVYWNLNTIDTIRYFTHGLEALATPYPQDKDRLEFMRLQLKNITQMPELPGYVYDQGYPGLKAHFVHYLENEVDYLERKLKGFVPLTSTPPERPKRDPVKVLCNLSIDQIGLILRAAYQTGYLEGTSLSEVMRAIAQWIATQNKEQINWKSLRGKSYDPEKRDVDISSDALSEMKQAMQEF